MRTIPKTKSKQFKPIKAEIVSIKKLTAQIKKTHTKARQEAMIAGMKAWEKRGLFAKGEVLIRLYKLSRKKPGQDGYVAAIGAAYSNRGHLYSFPSLDSYLVFAKKMK